MPAGAALGSTLGRNLRPGLLSVPVGGPGSRPQPQRAGGSKGLARAVDSDAPPAGVDCVAPGGCHGRCQLGGVGRRWTARTTTLSRSS